MALFRNRSDAGRRLAQQLANVAPDGNAIVLALPRGGVPVAYEIASALKVPLDVYIVRKLGVPGHEELAMGAVACDGTFVIDEETIALAGVTKAQFDETFERELSELRRRQTAYRGDRPEPELAGAVVIVVDDGLATGASMFAAVAALRQRHPAQIVVAVPVAPQETVHAIERAADRVVCIASPEYFGAVGLYYDDFSEVPDDEVRELLERAEQERKTWSIA